MIYRLLLLSDENDFFRREIKIDAQATFEELNNFILDSLHYSRQELSTFYVSDEEWTKGQEITLMDMGFKSSEYDNYLMNSTTLEELIEDKGDRLLFVFDMLSERALYIELVELISGTQPKPELIHAEGKAPIQTSTLEFAETRSVGGVNDLNVDEEDMYGSDVDMDDLDLEGFSEVDNLEDY